MATESSSPDVERIRRTIAIGCRILGHQGLSEDVLGHISARTGSDSILVRCRGPEERGLMFTRIDDVRWAAPPYEQADDPVYALPNELPIHVEVLAAFPEAAAVVHTHPPAVVASDLAGLPLLPIVGAYHIPAAKLAAEGIPVYPRGVLIRTTELAREMVASMKHRPVCVLRGHGITTFGESVEQAVSRALAVDSLARLTNRVVDLGGTPVALPAADLALLPDFGSGFNAAMIWRHYEARLEHAGLLEEL
jgi:ribulose-5-phosphate 4-epimerase/fuculose-1-phosphate aldolase